jgi:mono/diheme cytochrome c family protein
MVFYKDYGHILISTFTTALLVGAAGCNLYYGSGNKEEPPDVPLCGGEPGGGFDMGEFPLELGPTVRAETPPPPISGGTLALTPDETRAVAADPDRDQIYIVELATRSLQSTIPLRAGDEPGRVVVDDSQRAHVALRSGGAVAVVDVNEGVLLDRREVCAAPRGLALDAVTGDLYVACHGGELIIMDPATGQVLDSRRLRIGLRDVVVDADHIYVSTFRTAEVLVLDRQGRVLDIMRPPASHTVLFDPVRGKDVVVPFEPAVAWRMIPGPSGGVVVLHQRGRTGGISMGRGGYGGNGCRGSVVHAAITFMKRGQPTGEGVPISFTVLPVDFALSGDSSEAVIAAAGNVSQDFNFLPPLLTVRINDPLAECDFSANFDIWEGQVISVVVTTGGTTVAQIREPAQLAIFDENPFVPVMLSTDTRADTGHTMFHMNSGGGIACASCHPEGGDDARVWEFECIGPRRTQALQFGLLGTEPFHWDGDMPSFDTLMSEVFVGRMGGGTPATDQVAAMASWIDSVKAPARPAPVDSAAVERGRQLFQDSTVGCATCHGGPKLTNNGSFDVGTGGTFQVPSLINIVNRAPFMHTGCAATLRDRFTNPACGGGDSHGVVSHLSAQEIDDLIMYLETL